MSDTRKWVSKTSNWGPWGCLDRDSVSAQKLQATGISLCPQQEGEACWQGPRKGCI